MNILMLYPKYPPQTFWNADRSAEIFFRHKAMMCPHTQLSRRLKAEGRLLEKVPLRSEAMTDGINFIPKGAMTKREYLQHFAELVHEVYAPKAFFERILPALLTLRSNIPRGVIYRAWIDFLPVLFRQVFYLGIKLKGARFYFWKTFLQVLWNNPTALEAFGYDCLYFHHLNQHTDYIQHKLFGYLASPSPDDVLDKVVRDAIG